ncbi:acyl carrier protein [Lachnospiraceae bacterium 56-18]|jgi:acyl carrier protein
MMVKEKLQYIFREVFEDDDIILQEDMTAEDIEDWDSLTHIQLIENIEVEFGITFTLQEVTKLNNVGEFIDLTEQKVGEK